jgi:hypothetical protein
VNLPASGGWQTWETVNASVNLNSGKQTLTLDQDNGGWNFNDLTFAASGSSSPTASASECERVREFQSDRVCLRVADFDADLWLRHQFERVVRGGEQEQRAVRR